MQGFKPGILAWTAIAFFAWGVAESNAGETTGLDDSTIKIGLLAPITGAEANYGESYKTVTELLTKQANDSGGINSRKIELVVADEGCSGTTARAATNKLIVRDGVFAIVGGTCAAAIVPVVPLMVEHQVPFLTAMVIADKLTNPVNPNVFRAQVRATAIGQLMVTYAIDAFKPTRIAVVNQDDAYGAGELNGTLIELKKRNITLVAHETHKVGEPDLSAQALRLKEANPEVVLVHSYATQTAALVRKAFELGMRVQFVAGVASAATQIIQLIGEEASRGSFSAISVVVDPTGKSDPLTKDFVAHYVREYPVISSRPGIPGPGEFQVLGGYSVFMEGLKRAGRELTRSNFISALETVRNFKTGGYPSITFTKQNHDGVSSSHFWRYSKDGAIQLTDKLYTVE